MITILTPTYNRAHTLPMLFESLESQNKEFEWVIIDDGSNDMTQSLIESFQSKATFPIIYHYQTNGGKHTAINTGIVYAHGEWIFIVDSDDILSVDALECIQNTISDLPLLVLGFAFRRMYSNGNIIGKIIESQASLILTPTEAASLFEGDLAYIFRNEILKSNPFPIIQGETFVPELYLWNRISDLGPIMYIPNKAIYITEYLEDGYTKNFKRNLKRNPKGFALFYRDQFFRENLPLRKIKNALRYLQCFTYGMFR